MKSVRARWLAALIAPAVMVIGAGLIGIYTSGSGKSDDSTQPVVCEDLVPPGRRESSYQDSGIIPSHEQELSALPVYPGCVRLNDPVSNCAGSLAWFWATTSPTEAASLYSDELPALGWQAMSEPATVADPGKRLVTVLTFAKQNYVLTIYLDDNPSKGGELGNLYVTFRLQELSAEDSEPSSPSRFAVAEGVRPCGSDDLTSAYASRNGAMMAIFNGYGFGNGSESPCKLEGPPEVQLIDASGAELPTVTTSQPPCPGSSSCIEMGPVVLDPNLRQIGFGELQAGQAWILLVWRNHDGAVDCGSPRAARLRFTFQEGIQIETVIPELENMAPCEGRIEIWAFGPAPSG